MRSFFRRPSWANTGEETVASDFYRRSQQTYADIVAANREARGRQQTHANESSTEGVKAAKRQKVSAKASSEDPHLLVSLVGTQSPTQGRTNSQDPSPPREGVYIQTTSLTSDVINVPQSISGLSDSVKSPGYEQISDDTHGLVSSDKNQGRRSETSVFDDIHSQSPEAEHPNIREPESIQEDAVVQILITSEIANTKPLIVHRKMSQSLREVRLAWCKRQNKAEDLQSSAFLTWKGRRLFDVTTCKSLGIDRHSKFTGMGDVLPDDETPRIHMEAVTEDIFSSKNRRSLPATEAKPDSKVEGVPQDALIRVILKCPGLDDFKIKAKPKTRVSRLISSFRDAQPITLTQNVYLLFDGERLDPESCLQDYDIADLDLVDVQVK